MKRPLKCDKSTQTNGFTRLCYLKCFSDGDTAHLALSHQYNGKLRCWYLTKATVILDTFSAHYCDVIMGAMESQITSLMIVYSTVHSGTYERKHQSSASLAYGHGIHRWLVNSPHKCQLTRKMFPFDDVIISINGLPSYQPVLRWHTQIPKGPFY